MNSFRSENWSGRSRNWRDCESRVSGSRSERLKQEMRLRRELEAALRASRRQAAPLSRGTSKRDSKRPGRKPGRGYGRKPAASFRVAWTNRSPSYCPIAARIVAAAWNGKAPKPSIRKRLCGGPSCAVSILLWATVVSAADGCGGAIGLQTSDAVGVGKVQLGPEALTVSGDPE